MRLKGRNLGFTWARVEMTNQELMRQLQEVLGDNIEYALACQEKHADGGLHNHAYVKLRSPLNTFDARMFDFNGRHAHVESVKNVSWWIAYCKKTSNWIEVGNCPIKELRLSKKEKNDLIREKGIRYCVDEGVIGVGDVPKINNGIQALRILENTPRTPPVVWWLHGKTGTGKTRFAVVLGENNFWISGGDLKWFDGYTGQSTAIFDDLRAGSCAFNFLLRLLDRYPLIVPIKGGFTKWSPEKIVITCPVRPEELFVNHETGETWDHVDQLIRRITNFRDFDQNPWNEDDAYRERVNEVDAEVAAEVAQRANSQLSSIPPPPPPPAELNPVEPEFNLDLRMGQMEDLPEVSCGFHPVLDTWWDGEKYVKPVERKE